MVVICAGTSGYDTMVDVRYLWYPQKRYQGSHLFNDEQAAAFNDLVRGGKVHTTHGRTFAYEESGLAHQLMGVGELPEGNVAVLISAPNAGLSTLPLALLHELDEDAAHVPGVDERDRRPARSSARRLVDQPDAVRPELLERLDHALDPVPDVVDALAAFLEEPADRRVRTERAEELDERRSPPRTAPPRRPGRPSAPGGRARARGSSGTARPRPRDRRPRCRRDRSAWVSRAPAASGLGERRLEPLDQLVRLRHVVRAQREARLTAATACARRSSSGLAPSPRPGCVP